MPVVLGVRASRMQTTSRLGPIMSAVEDPITKVCLGAALIYDAEVSWFNGGLSRRGGQRFYLGSMARNRIFNAPSQVSF